MSAQAPATRVSCPDTEMEPTCGADAMRALTLADLPPEDVSNIALWLPPRDLINFALTCKAVKDISLCLDQFRKRFRSMYAIDFADPTSIKEVRLLYGSVHKQMPHLLRFQALSTDGGVDKSGFSNQMLYWVDNMFTANNLEGYCSEAGHSARVLAVITSSLPSRDTKLLAYADFLRCVLAHVVQRLQDQVTPQARIWRRPLTKWTLFDMEHFMLQCYSDQGGLRLLLDQGLQSLAAGNATKLQSLREDVHKACIAFYERHFAAGGPDDGPDANRAQSLRHPDYDVVADPDDANLLMDARLISPAFKYPHSSMRRLGLIERVSVSRKGGFSCPVLTGAILAAVHGLSTSGLHATAGPHSASAGGSTSRSSGVEGLSDAGALDARDAAARVRALTGQPLPDALRGCVSYETLQLMVDEGRLPPVAHVQVLRKHGHFVATVVEFKRRSPPHGQAFEAVLWFRFFTRAENERLRAWSLECAERHDPDSPVPTYRPQPPQGLQWVADVLQQSLARSHDVAAPDVVSRLDAKGEASAPFSPAAPGQGSDAAAACDAAISARQPGLPAASGTAVGAGAAYVSSRPAAHASEGESAAAATSEQSRRAAAPSLSEAFADDAQDDDDDDDDLGSSDLDGEADAPEAGSHGQGTPMTAQQRRRLRGTYPRTRFDIKLRSVRAANMVCVHLIDQENLMQFWDDEHPDPNIDINFVKLTGRSLDVPDYMRVFAKF